MLKGIINLLKNKPGLKGWEITNEPSYDRKELRPKVGGPD